MPPTGDVDSATPSVLVDFSGPEVLNAVRYGAYITDRSRKIVFWSDAAERITGWPSSEVIGRSCSEHILAHTDQAGHELCGHFQCPLCQTLDTGEEIRQPVFLFARHKQGHRIPVEVSVAPLRNRSGQMTGALQLFRELTRTVEDLRRAKIIQDYVLQANLPADPRVRFEVSYRPEEIVGGDFYRIQPITPHRYAIMVADVMGHGLISALYTVQLRSIWDECQAELASPAAFLNQLNGRLHKLASPEGYFATAVLVLVDVGSGEVRYARAGHPAPLLFRPGARTPEPLNGRSPAVGLMESVTYTENELHLGPGDSLLLFTDGAIDIANAQGDVLGEGGFQRLLESIPDATKDLRRIEGRLLEFSNSLTLPDDLTLLSIQLAESRSATNLSTIAFTSPPEPPAPC
jgi:PAS domain S-box-containing protein